MSIVSVTASANGIANRVTSAREAASSPELAEKGSRIYAAVRTSSALDSGPRERVVVEVQSAERSSLDRPFAPSDDSRYVKFIEAVQALRLDREGTDLTETQIARIMASGKEIFWLDDGIPRDVRPPQPSEAAAKLAASAEAAQVEQSRNETAAAERQERADRETSRETALARRAEAAANLAPEKERVDDSESGRVPERIERSSAAAPPDQNVIAEPVQQDRANPISPAQTAGNSSVGSPRKPVVAEETANPQAVDPAPVAETRSETAEVPKEASIPPVAVAPPPQPSPEPKTDAAPKTGRADR